MVHVMICRSWAAVGALALAGCAQESGSHPAFIGLSDLAGNRLAAPQTSTSPDNTPDVLRHIQSNKVLGAMAFQKITGQTVDPDSLAGRSE